MRRHILLAGIILSGTALADQAAQNILNTDRIDITPINDHSVKMQDSSSQLILTPIGADQANRFMTTYFPGTETFSLLAAYIIDQNNKRTDLPKSDMVTQRSAASQEAPGFTNSLSVILQFPQLQPKQTVHVSTVTTNNLNSITSFTPTFMPDSGNPTKQMSIVYHNKPFFKLYWAKSKAFHLDETREALTASIKDQSAIIPEVNMVSATDVLPYFSISAVKTWSEFGQQLWKQYKPLYNPSAHIKATANAIAGNSTGLEAAKKLYQWEINHIHYVAIYLNETAQMVPNSADTILKRGYGDCKDYVTLLSNLLLAKGIEARPAMANWSYAFRQYPIPSNLQFNHAILYLPQYKMFLNPTDIHSGFGHLDSALINTPAIVLGDKSFITHTQAGQASDNGLESMSTVTLNEDGSLRGSTSTNYQGNFNTVIRSTVLAVTSGKELADNILSTNYYGGTGDLKWSDPKNILQKMHLQGEWQSNKAIGMGQNPVYLRMPSGINIFKVDNLKSTLTMGQRHSAMVSGKRTLTFNQQLTIPKTYHFSQVPKAVNTENAVGKYSATYEQSGLTLQKHSQLLIKQNVVAAKDYPLYLKLIETALADQHAYIGIQKGQKHA